MANELLLAKKQVTAHVVPAMTAADTIWAENVSHKPTGQRVELNPARPDYGSNEGVIVGEHVELTFDTLLVGSGTPGEPPPWSKIAKAAGWAETVEEDESVTYSRAVQSDTSDVLAFDWSDVGRHHQGVDGRGKTDIKLARGQPPRLGWLFRNIMIPVAARTPVVADDADFSDWLTTRPMSFDLTTFTLGGHDGIALYDLTANGADNVKFIDLPEQKGVFHRGNPAFSGSIKAAVPPIGVWSPEAKWIAGTKETITVTHGTEAGNIVTISFVAQFDAPSWSKEDDQDVFTSNIYLTTAPTIVLT